MAKKNEAKTSESKKAKTDAEKSHDKLSPAPGEVRNNLQVVVRVLVALLIVVVVGGFLWALFLRPERVIENSQFAPTVETVLEG